MGRGLFGFGFIFIFGLAPLILGVVALVDATKRSDGEWERAGQNKTLWVVLIVVGFFTCIFGVVIDLVYLFSVRTHLEAVAPNGAPSYVSHAAPTVPHGPQSGWYPDPYARHELRYFDGVHWNDHVSDSGVPGIDPTG